MANFTRAELRNQIYQYLPHANQSTKLTMVNNCIDLALEEISQDHDFICLRGTSLATATITGGQYYFHETALGPRVFATDAIVQGVDWIKDIISLWLFDVGGNSTKFLRYLDTREFDNTYDAEDIASRGSAAANTYTRLGQLYLLDCPADKGYKVLARYQMYHPRFGLWSTCSSTATTATSSSTTILDPSTATIWFDAKDQMYAMNAIVYIALRELKMSMTSVEFPQEMQAIDALADKWKKVLIARDSARMDEQVELGWAERTASSANNTESPYSWVP